MARPRRIAILGGGRLAYGALGMVRPGTRAGDHVVFGWGRSADARRVLQEGGATVVASPEDAVTDAAVVILCVPAPSLAEVTGLAAPAASGDQIVVHAARGVGADFALPHEILRAVSCWKKIVALGGPLYLDDAGSGRALNAAIASRFDEAIDIVRAIVRGAPLRLSATHDIVGVELCGALSNVGHLAAGLAAGAGLGETEQGLLHVRALLEAGRLGRLMGAERATFSGLAGVGDLIPRRVSSQRRHRDVGSALGAGTLADSGDDAAARNALEGVFTAREGARFATRQGLSAPLLSAIQRILDDGAPVGPTLLALLDTELGLQAA
jgi:glycerol-3-phosphate dehydrogenase (NAD(P)+)